MRTPTWPEREDALLPTDRAVGAPCSEAACLDASRSTWPDVEFVEACSRLCRQSCLAGHLSERQRVLVRFATAAADTGADPDRLRELTLGLTSVAGAGVAAEAAEVLALQAVHSLLAVGKALEEGAVTASTPVEAEVPGQLDRLRDEYQRLRGYWSPGLDAVARRVPGTIAAYATASAFSWRGPALDPADRELVHIVGNCVAGGPASENGLRLHLRRALEHGLTEGQVTQAAGIAAMEQTWNRLRRSVDGLPKGGSTRWSAAASPPVRTREGDETCQSTT